MTNNEQREPMRDKLLAGVFAATMVVSTLVGVAPASATAPTVNSGPTISITGSIASLVAGGTWSAGSTVNQFYACTFPTPVNDTKVTSVQTVAIPGGCLPLFSNAEANVPFTGGNLLDAFYDPDMAYPPLVASRPHVVVISKNTDGGTQSYVFSPSVEFSIPEPT
jgi:hypothetical protein